MSYKKSKIDELFNEIYGFYPSKEGQSYEILVNAVFKIISDDSIVKNNQFVKGIYSKQAYQIDGIIISNNYTEVIESKDYTKREKPVGRPDIQKLEGALIDIEADSGRFASATGYTKNALKYANGTESNPIAKIIDLYDVRPSTDEDENGRIKFIEINIITKDLDLENMITNPRFTQNGYKKLFPILKVKYPDIQDNFPIIETIEHIYNEDGTIYTSIASWSKTIKVNLQSNYDKIHATWLLKNKYLMIYNTLIEIAGIEYTITINVYTRTVHITPDGNAKILIKNADGSIDTLITDYKLKNVLIDDTILKLKS